jgi:stearoyl-CoA desaturase (delta-9 desaturase)
MDCPTDYVEEAVFPADELSKYKLEPAIIDNNKNKNNDDIYVVKIKKKTKLKVQSANKPSNIIRRHISEGSWTLRNWYAHIHWKNFIVVVLLPLIGIFSFIYFHPKLIKNTMFFMIWNYIITLISINILYHRYWSHHSFNFTHESFVQFLTIICSGGGITSAKNWCSSHRAHHRYCDITDTDPHNIRRGLFFSHMGWMILIHHEKASRAIKQSKLDELPNEDIVQWQLRNYFVLFIIVGLILPSLICGYFWNDYIGGLIYGGFLKVLMVQHSIFSINSIGHTIGSRPYNNTKSHRNNYLLSLITMGEGNQNFHQEFPMDYRNGYEWYNFDPTKWAIRLLEILGQINDIKIANQSTIEKSLIQQQQRLLDDIRSQLNWGIPIDRLPIFTPGEFKKLAERSKDRYLVVVSGIVHDVTPFALDHPGGLPLIKASHGKDATTAFNGAVYQHSNAAKNLLATMRIGKLGGSESLYWKQQRIENKSVPIDNDSEGKRIVRVGGQETSFGQLGSTAGAA